MIPKLNKSHRIAWRTFLTKHAKLIDLIEYELAEAKLPPLDWYDVLLALSEAPAYQLRMHELAHNIVLSRSNLTRLVDRLEAAKLLYRASCSTDRRGAFAVLTAKGLTTLHQMWPVYARSINKHFARHLSDTEVSILTGAFQRLLSATDNSKE